MDELINGLFAIITIATGLYALSKLPKRIDYRKLWMQLKANFFKMTTVVLLLYSAWLSLVHYNYKKDFDKRTNELFRSMESLDSCELKNENLAAQIDSMTSGVTVSLIKE
jgi:hypothetical protein